MIGRELSHYRILSPLGKGGMGEVFLAQDTRLDRKVAIKFLAPHLIGSRDAEIRFRNEARAAAEISHPNIATIFDFDQAEGDHFLIFEYLDGESLKERLARGPLSVDEVLRVGRGVAAGLTEAHSHGVVHRDIKPANVMITAGGNVKILDFGLARRADATRITSENTALGTLEYMSPEVVRGEAADGRSDIWSTGVLLYECLTGKRPFTGDMQAAISNRVLTDAPTPPTGLRSGIPPALEHTILRCLEKERGSRTQSAADLHASLLALGGPSSSSAPALAVVPASRRWDRVAIVFVVLLGVAAALWFARERMAGVSEQLIPRLAVARFADLTTTQDPIALAGLGALLQVGLADLPSLNVVSPEYLRQIRTRDGTDAGGAIPSEKILQVARAAQSTHVLVGDVLPATTGVELAWRLVETSEGSITATGTVDASDWSRAANQIVVRVADVFAETRPHQPTGESPVTERLSIDPVAYRYYATALLAMEDGRYEDARNNLLRAVDTDSTFALAHYELSRVYNPNSQMDEAKEAARRAWRHRDFLGRKKEMLLQAHQKYLAYKVGEAADAYEDVVTLWPDSREALVGRTQNYFYFRFWRDALASADEGLHFYPEDIDLQQAKIGALVQLDQLDAALTLADRVRRGRPANLDAPGQLGDIYLLQGEFDAAERSFHDLLALEPNNLEAKRGLSWCAYGRGELSQAIRILEELLADPTTPDHQKRTVRAGYSGPGLFNYYVDAGRIRDLIRASTTYEDPLPRKGEYLLGARLPHEALALVSEPEIRERLTRESPIAALIEFSHVTRALAETGEVERAGAAYQEMERIVAADRNLPRGFHERNLRVAAEVALAEGNPTLARESMDELFEDGYLRMGWGEFAARLTDAQIYEFEEEFGKAIASLEESIRIFGGNTLFHFELAKVYERVGRTADAKTEYHECLRLWEDADVDYPYPDQARQRLAALGG
jgi:tetratricopeptide (TPR) repeat protein/TolB-like protein